LTQCGQNDASVGPPNLPSASCDIFFPFLSFCGRDIIRTYSCSGAGTYDIVPDALCRAVRLRLSEWSVAVLISEQLKVDGYNATLQVWKRKNGRTDVTDGRTNGQVEKALGLCLQSV